MNFPVPWRCLMPYEVVDFLLYDSGAVLRELSDRTGALIHISGDRDTPRRLSDRIVTISGQADQKEGACRGLVDRLRKLQDLQDATEVGFFVLILPASSVPVVVGAKGANIQEVLLAADGVELSIGKENVMGMPDTPVGLEGTTAQVVAAAAGIHKVVQDMADRGRLLPSDFKYRPEKAAQQLASGAGMALPEVSLPPAQHDVFGGLDPTQNFRTKAKMVIDSQTAGWLIGKGGRTIREMQMNSGAFLHILREEECPAFMQQGDRLLEICGRYERKLEGLQVVMRTADNMPGNQAPKDTHLLVPSRIAQSRVTSEVAATFDCTVTAHDYPGHDESLVTLMGPISSRIQAAQDFLTRTDKAHMDGSVVALSVDGEAVGKDGRPRKELRDAGVALEPAAERNQLTPPPPTNSLAEAPLARATRPQSPVPSQPWPWPAERLERAPTPPQDKLSGTEAPWRARSQPPEERLDRPHTPPQEQPRYPWPADHRLERPPTPPKAQPSSSPSAARAPQRSPADEGKRFESAAPALAAPAPRRPAAAEEPWADWAASRTSADASASEAPAVPAAGPQTRHEEAAAEPRRSEAALPRGRDLGTPPLARHEEQLSVAMGSAAGRWPDPEEHRQAGEAVPPPMAMAEPPPAAAPEPAPQRGQQRGLAGPADEVDAGAPVDVSPLVAAGPRVEAALLSSSQCAQAPSQLALLLPDALLQRGLVPSGHLKEVAQRCRVRIDLSSDAMPPFRQVTLTGSVVGNAAAAYWIQVGLAGVAHRCG